MYSPPENVSTATIELESKVHYLRPYVFLFQDSTTCIGKRHVGQIRNGFNKTLKVKAPSQITFGYEINGIIINNVYESYYCTGIYTLDANQDAHYYIGFNINIDSKSCYVETYQLINNNHKIIETIAKREPESEYLIFGDESSHCKI